MKYIIFDLDGTILDTLQDLTNAVNYGLKCFNLPTKDKEFVRLAIGNGTKVLIKRCTPCDISDEIRDQVFNNFKSYYFKHFTDNTKPYPGIYEMLLKLKESKKVKLIVLSNKDDDLTKQLINKEFPRVFDIVQGSYIDKPRKPDPYLINKIFNENNINKEDCLYIGDTNVDKETADNSGIKYLLVNYGYRSKEELEKMCPKDTTISSIDELYHTIVTYSHHLKKWGLLAR